MVRPDDRSAGPGLAPDLQNPHEPLVIESESIEYMNLDDTGFTKTHDRVLILTPLRDAASHLRQHFKLLSELTYAHQAIDLAFLVGDCKDDTLSTLSEELANLQRDSNPERFRSAMVIQKDFRDTTGQSVEERHSFRAQGTRRKAIGRSRNYLLYAALRPVHNWVYWRDVDIVDNPKSILEDFMKHDKDVLVPSRLTSKHCGQPVIKEFTQISGFIDMMRMAKILRADVCVYFQPFQQVKARIDNVTTR